MAASGPSAPFAGRVAVVTGASRGVGAAVGLALGAAGAHVVAVARTVGGLEELDDRIRAAGGSATLVPMDLADYPAIDRLGAAINQRWGKLDILVGNAGLLGAITPLAHLEPRVFDAVMAVNVTANWRLIRSLDLPLRRAEAGRALFFTSGITRAHLPYWGAYAASKAALEALVRTYAAELRTTTRATANLFNPGPLRTRLRAQAAPGEDPGSLKPPEAIVADVLRMLAPAYGETGVLFDYPSGITSTFR